MIDIVLLTGAGVSAESGLGTFRETGGIWSQYDLAEVATPEGFARDPALVHRFYNARRANCIAASPNAAHTALADLQRQHRGRVTLVTQNIDDLHERAGSKNVVHMHGELMQARCQSCGARWAAPHAMSQTDPCPSCGAQACRPDVVWFGEIPHFMDVIGDALAAADLFVAIGTSGRVYPAAGFVDEARTYGVETLEINLDPTDLSGRFDSCRVGPATQAVPAWVVDVLANAG